MRFFRVDKRLFAVGDKITTAQEYYDRFPPEAKLVEDELELHRPESKISRTSCLFVFDDLLCAKKLWSKMKDGKLYQVEIDEASIHHRGDMALMDAMKARREAGEDASDLAKMYWRGDLSNKPEPEVLIPCAIVVEIISADDAERRAYLIKRWKGLA